MNLPAEDLADIINALLNTGFVETVPFKDQIKPEEIDTVELEVNPSFAHDLKAAMGMRK